MAAEDIYRLDLHFEGPSQPASIGLYYQESSVSTDPAGATESLAQSFDVALSGRFASAISEDWQLTAVVVRRVNGDPIPKYVHSLLGRPGQRNGASLPANNALLIQLFQTLFTRKSNGRIYVPGIAEGDTLIGRTEQTYQDDAVIPLANRIAQAVLETNGSGVWIPGVISAKQRDLAPPFKDWDGAFSPMVGALGWPVIARQVRRQTKVIGGF